MTDKGKAVVGGCVIGVVIALAMGIAFGVMDIQCGSGAKGNWNAERQVCE